MDNTNRYCSVEQSIIESFKQITEIRSQKIKKKTWDELVSEEEEGDIIPNLKLEENACTYKVRAANTNANVGKSNGYRMLFLILKKNL